MNVCLLNDSFPPVIDGVVNVVMNYANYLTQDHQAAVVVGTPRYPEADYGQYPYPVVAYPSFDTAAVASGYRAGNPFGGEALEELAGFHPEIIHSHCPASSTVVARLLREKTEAPVVFTYHTKYDIDIRRVVHARLAAHEAITAMVSNIEACDEVWTVSRGAGESLKALGFRGDYRVMANGVDFPRGRVPAAQVTEATAGWDLPEGVPVFLFVGRMMTYKGLPLILDALKLLADRGRDFRMVFIGKGPDRELLEDKARALGLMDSAAGPDRCFFTGPIYDRDVLRAWNTRADLFLFPSTFDTNGLVVREAAACGLGSVLIRGSCAAEGVTDGLNGFTIEETPEALAALLEKVSGDLGRLRQVGDRAMEELYLSWQDCVAQAYERYRVILEEKARGELPLRKKLPADWLVSVTAKTMEERARRRRVYRELFRNFRETAVGMMENIQEAEETAEHFLDRLSGELHRGPGRGRGRRE
jgi:glycosyltransferase involved in cell wall biosynthesis